MIVQFPRHFDKNQSGKLEYIEFKACLRSLGYELSVLEQGQTDAEFEQILDKVDSNRCVSIDSVLTIVKQKSCYS